MTVSRKKPQTRKASKTKKKPVKQERAEKSLGGRPAHYTSEKTLEAAIRGYFKCLPTRRLIVGGVALEVPAPTITGLALHLGFESRQSFYDYEKGGRFSYVIKKARLLIEHEYEKLLHGATPTGAIFALKNFGWADRHEVTGPDGGPIRVVERVIVSPANTNG